MRTIGKYRLRAVLGRGAMGTVYEAVDPVTRRRVALKVMAQEVAASAELCARFRREAEAAGRLQHPNVVRILDLGEHQGQPFIVMERVAGDDLDAVLRWVVPPPLEWKLDVLRQLCEALGHAHAAGIVHRDVKPANVRVTRQGDVKLMDFGIAHLHSSTLTRRGAPLGTIHYMAPEQLRGRAVDARADIFSVGAIAYEMFSGRRPFTGESLTQVMFRITHDRADPAGLPPTACSPHLERLILKALEPSPDARYRSMRELLRDLEGVVRQAAPRLLAAADKREESDRACGSGEFSRALQLRREVAALVPGEVVDRLALEMLGRALHARDLQELSGQALASAAAHDFDVAFEIAGRVAALAPGSEAARSLEAYLSEESAGETADVLAATAQDHLALGNLEEARAAAEEALSARPTHRVARQIHDGVSRVLDLRRRSYPAPPGP